MIICSCNVISHDRIRQAVLDLVANDPNRLITPGMVYKQLGYVADCGGCVSCVVGLVHDTLDELAAAGRYLPPPPPKHKTARPKQDKWSRTRHVCASRIKRREARKPALPVMPRPQAPGRQTALVGAAQ